MKIENIFGNLPLDSSQEHFTEITNADSVRIERIVSPAGCELDGKWHDQTENEWVTVLQGFGAIVFEDARVVSLKPGDHILISAHEKHRVIKTSKEEPTVWLAVFYP